MVWSFQMRCAGGVDNNGEREHGNDDDDKTTFFLPPSFRMQTRSTSSA